MQKLQKLLTVLLLAFVCPFLTSCSGGGGVTEPDNPGSGNDDNGSLGETLKRQIEWQATDEEVADTADLERRVDVSNVVMYYDDEYHRNKIHKHAGAPSYADDSQVVYAWQQIVSGVWKVKFKVAYNDDADSNPDWSDVYTISDGDYNNSYPAVTSYMKETGKMTIDVVYQMKNASNKVSIRHDRWVQGTVNVYNSFSHAAGFPKTVNQTTSYNCLHPDVVYYGITEDNDDDDDTYRYLFCVYERFTNSTGSKGNREIWWAKYDEDDGIWGYGRTMLYGPTSDYLPMYPRIDCGMDDTGWGLYIGDGGHLTCVVWQTYQYSVATIIDIDIWASMFPPTSPTTNLSVPITWDGDSADLDEYDRWDVFPYVDIDPYENASTRCTNIVWTHFKNSDDTDPTNFYYNTEMEQGGEPPVTVKDDGDSTVQEGFITYAARGDSSNPYKRRGCAVWIDDGENDGYFPVYATEIDSYDIADIEFDNRIEVSAGVCDDNIAGVYGPVPATRFVRTVHVGWCDWDSANSDWGIYADWHIYSY